MKNSNKEKERFVVHNNFHSNILNNERDIIVWLPPSYEDSDKSYPVLYMHDGQNLFNNESSFSGSSWKVNKTVLKLIREKKIDELIIVGIYNTPQRLKEYSISLKGENYIHFIIKELKVFIDKNYKTKSGREFTSIMGSSMGGLTSFYAIWKFPNIFSKAACLSSSFYYGGNKAIKLVKDEKKTNKNIKIYIDHGEDGIKEGQAMFTALSEKGYRIGKEIDYFYAAGAQHNEADWAERLERPFLFLFGKNYE